MRWICVLVLKSNHTMTPKQVVNFGVIVGLLKDYFIPPLSLRLVMTIQLLPLSSSQIKQATKYEYDPFYFVATLVSTQLASNLQILQLIIMTNSSSTIFPILFRFIHWLNWDGDRFKTSFIIVKLSIETRVQRWTRM